MNKDEIQFLKIPNYRIISGYARENFIHGETAILIRDNITDFDNVQWITNLSVEKEIEVSCAISNTRKMIILTVYRTCLGDAQIFLRKIEQILYEINMKFNKYDVVLCGDFNINLLEDSHVKNNFVDILCTYDLQQTIVEPTRITRTTKTLIDNIFTNTPTFENNYNINSLLSDHMAQFIAIKCNNVPNGRTCIRKRTFTDSKMQQFFSSLEDVSWRGVLERLDPDEAYNCFSEIMQMYLNLIFPERKCSMRRTMQTWITTGIKISSNRKRSMWEEVQEGIISLDYYKSYCRILKQVVKQAKMISHRNYITQSENKTKATWNLVSTITGKKNNNDDLIFNSFPNQDEEDVLDQFNKHFISSNRSNSGTDADNSNIKSCNKSIFLSPLIEQETYQYILQLKNKNSVGSDNIPVKLLKKCASIIKTPLAHIINQILQTGKYPQRLKEAMVKPIYKKGSKENIDNYRPISLLSNVNKIFERIIFDKLMQFFEANNILLKQQYGFRQGKSTLNAIYQALTSIIRSLNQNNATAALCLDLSKAFDRVNHEKLLAKMEKYGIRGVALKLIESYLSKRTQKTISRGRNGNIIRSDSKQVLNGVPQGSILGPLLYIIYANDLVQTTNNDVIMFADDASIICRAENQNACIKSLETDLKNMNEWFLNNNLMLNLEKTKLLIFRKNNEQLNLTFQDCAVESVENLSFLGVNIDRNLNWSSHVEKISPMIARYGYALRTIRMIGLDAALTAYHAYVHSRIRYGIIFWGRSTEAQRVFLLQKRCLRIIFGMNQYETCRNIFKNFNILTLYGLYIYESVMFIVNNYNDFKDLQLQHSYNTRGKNILQEDKPNYSYLQKNVTYSLLTLWNKLPEKFKSLPNKVQKQKLKSFLIDKSYYNIGEFLQEGDFEKL